MAKLLLRGLPLGTVSGVLFDKDGTLSHSEPRLIKLAEARIDQAILCFKKIGADPDQTRKLRYMLIATYGLSDKGLHPGGVVAVAARHHNLISTATVFCLMGQSWPQAFALANDVFTAADEIEASENYPLQGSGKLLDGSRNLLNALTDHGVACAIISNDTLNGIQEFMTAQKLNKVFSDIWSADDQPAKPDPKAVEALCKRLNLRPKDCALIGDADSDLQMARSAGIEICLGFTSGWQRPPELTAHEHLIHNWDELTVIAETKVHQN